VIPVGHIAQAGRLCHLEKPVWKLADYIHQRLNQEAGFDGASETWPTIDL
jgi:hypothetical protein